MQDQGPGQSGDYREIRALLEGLSVRVDDTRADAREARDAANKLTERLAAQDVPKQLAELAGRVEQGFQAARGDLVNSMDKITRETRADLLAHHQRITELENFRQRIEGAGGLVGWVAKHVPWLLSVIFGAAAAALAVKDKLTS